MACGGSSDDSAGDQVDQSIEEVPAQIDQPDGTDDAGADASDDGSDDALIVPDGWPEFLAVPDGFTIESSQSRTMTDGRDLSLVDALGEGDLEEIFATYEAAVTDAGFQIKFQNDLDDVYHLTAADDDWTVEVEVEESPQSPGKASVALKYQSNLESSS